MCIAESVEIQVEVIPVVINGLGVHYIEHDGRDGRWLRQLCSTDGHPMEVAKAMLIQAWSEVGVPLVVHGTSWRYDSGGITLTFVAVLSEAVLFAAEWWQAEIVRPAPIVYGEPTAAPPVVTFAQVRDHAIRHLAFLAEHDPAVQASLPVERAALAVWLPAPAAAYAA